METGCEGTVLAFDIGTSAIKASVLSGSGQVLLSGAHAYRTRYTEGGRAEQAPEDWWQGMKCLAADFTARAPNWAREVAAIGVSGHMLGCLPVNAKGEALHPALIHSDSRAARQCADVGVKAGADAIYQMSGNPLDARASLCKILWFLEEEPAIYHAASRFLQCKDYIVSRLTGEIDTTDYSDASHGGLIDLRTKRYDEALYRTLGIDMSKLPAVRRSIDIIGPLTAHAAADLHLPAGIPVIAGAGDGASAALGASALGEGDAYLCLGTTAWITVCSQQPVFDAQKRIFQFLSADNEGYCVTGATESACAALNWILGLLEEEEPTRADLIAAGVAPGSDGLIFLPYLSGERSPVYDRDARGMFFGLCAAHTRAHLIRASLEGVALALKDIFRVFQEHFNPGRISRMRIIGGGAKSSLWREIIASACGLRLDTLQTASSDITSAGIGFAAATAAGFFPSLAEAVHSVRKADETHPNPAWTEIYARSYTVYAQLYPRLRDLFQG